MDLYNRQSVRKVTSFGKIILTVIEVEKFQKIKPASEKTSLYIIKTLNFRENAE